MERDEVEKAVKKDRERERESFGVCSSYCKNKKIILFFARKDM